MHAKSTGELTRFGFSDRSVRSLVSVKRSANHWVQTEKKRLQFLADLWSLSEFRTQRKTNPKSEMTRLELLNVLDFLNEQTNINFLYRNAQLSQQ